MRRGRPAGGAPWGAEVAVSAPLEPARRPTVAVFQAKLWVAYERSVAAGGRDVVAARRLPSGGFHFQTLAHTPRESPLDVILHSEPGALWLDWKHSENEFCWMRWVGAGSFGSTNSEDWSDPTWVGSETTRKRIRHAALAP